MHCGLKITEIVELICEQVGMDRMRCSHVGLLDSRTLSILARTSHFFLNPALDVLWRHQNTIVNLLRCMPKDLLKIYELQRAITSADWERVLFYAPRVKSLSIDVQSMEPLDFFEALSLSLPGDYLFPNLRKLRWGLQPPSAFQYVRFFLRLCIRDLHIAPMDTASQLSILCILPVRCPNLTNIDLTILPEEGWDSVVPVVSHFVRGLKRIESLRIPGLDQLAFAHLAQLQDLRSLSLRPPFKFIADGSSLEPDTFPSLKQITFSNATLDSVTLVLPQLSNARLTEFYITSISGRLTEAVSRQFYSTLAKTVSHSSLREISITATHVSCLLPITTNRIELFSVGDETIRPLLSFRNLVILTLHHPVGFDFDDAAVLSLARAWPRIEFLSLEARPYHHAPSRVTLKGLYAFAKHCPRLCVLAMTFDATGDPRLQGVSWKRRAVQTSLECLHVAASRISKPRRVGKFLAAVFPGVSCVKTLSDERMFESDGGGLVAIEQQALASHFLWKQALSCVLELREG
ncbi:hypothetical protein C8R43DRAFT_1071635 [Mycena crocata]|nr:hypothetical protein C8R43DRAFT_1071635 [Mycena crocata]